jgi:flagellar biosynthetic protein FliR
VSDPVFPFSNDDLFTFFAVLVRYSVLITLMPITGDRVVPGPVKILLSLAISFALFPALREQGWVRPADAAIWSATAIGILSTVGLEALAGALLAFTARILFDAVSFGANLISSFMGYSAATFFDPHFENQTQVLSEFQMALVMLCFLALDGHHLLLRAALESYQWVGLGGASIGPLVVARLTEMTSQLIFLGIRISAPIGISLFGVNVAFGVLARTMPQMNILVLSFSITALVGFVVLLSGVPEWLGASTIIVGWTGDWMSSMARALSGR